MDLPQVAIIGGGMITQVQLLPSIYQLQRQNLVGKVSVCALTSQPLKTLAEDVTIKSAFPQLSFTAYPPLDPPLADPAKQHPHAYRDMLNNLPPQSIAVVAVPDQLHYQIITDCLNAGQHVLTVKPLVLKYTQAVEIEKLAYEKGLVVGIEYHKRADYRALMARQFYRQGKFGQFRIGHAEMNEPWYYRNSNFQNWCTCENSDMFTYVGCHYVDQVAFITGLKPTAVSVYGIRDKYPNGNEGFLWTDARVIWENSACLNVTNVMAYPDDAPGGNYQGIRMYFAGPDKAGMLFHDDQYRGMKYCFVEKSDQPGDTLYSEPSSDYFKYIDMGSQGLTPVGYGFRSVELIVNNIRRAIEAGEGLDSKQALVARRKLIKQLDAEGIMATPANSSYNELVTEAARLSILNNAKLVNIEYQPKPRVLFAD